MSQEGSLGFQKSLLKKKIIISRFNQRDFMTARKFLSKQSTTFVTMVVIRTK